MGPPLDRESLRHSLEQGVRLSFRFFWGHRAKTGALSDSCFSQWWPAQFAVLDQEYASAEQFMMASKARLFGDVLAMEQILATNDPAEAKNIGRRVAGYEDSRWAALRFDLVTLGNVNKFGQDERLRTYLLDTGDDVLVEASPVDKIWGIGLAQSDVLAQDPASWRGENLLGFALIRARAILRGEIPEPSWHGLPL